MKIKTGSSYDIAISNDFKFVSSIHCPTKFFEFESGKKISQCKPLKHPSHIGFSPDSTFLIVKNTSGQIAKITNFHEPQNKLIVKDSQEGSNFQFTKDSKSILHGDWDGNIYLTKFYPKEHSIIKSYPGYSVNNVKTIESDTFAFLISPKYNQLSGIKDRSSKILILDSNLRISTIDLPSGHIDDFILHNKHEITILSTNHNMLANYNLKSKKYDKILETIKQPKKIEYCYFRKIYAIVAYKSIYILGLDFSILKRLDLEFPCHARFHSNGIYTSIGAWNQGYIYSTDDLLKDTHNA